MTIFGQKRTVYGTLAVISADNLGSLACGFKESCTATKMCRHCMATREESQTKVCFYILPNYSYILYIYFYLSLLIVNLLLETRYLTSVIAVW